MEMEFKLILEGLTCANCGEKIQDRASKLQGVKEAVLNFSISTLIVETEKDEDKERIISEIKAIVKRLEPDVKVSEKKNKSAFAVESTCSEGCCSGTTSSNGSCSTEACDCGDSHHDHHHHHDHGHSHGDGSLKSIFSIKDNIRLIIGIGFYIAAFAIGKDTTLGVISFVISYILIGGEIVLTAIKNILRGEVFDENFLMTIATMGAFAIGEHPEAVGVMLFYEIGEVFQGYAVGKSRTSITSLMNIRADYANLIKNEKEVKVTPESVAIGEFIIVKPGERVPLDGVVVEGKSFVDTSALTGESVPRQVKVNEELLAGCINNNGVLKVQVTKSYGESTVARILELVENASSKKATIEKFITKFAKVYTPLVVFLALALGLIPPIITGDPFSEWIYRALIFLVVSCPCALVVSIPLGLFAGIGGASKKGILVKGGNYLEALKDVDTIVFDKTGTLTKGVFKVTEINNINIEKDELLKLAAIGESKSNHPIAQSIVKEYGKEIDNKVVGNYEEISGHGIKVSINGSEVLLGNYKLMEEFGVDYNKVDTIGTIIHIAVDNSYKGNIIISDEVKENSKIAIEKLKALGIKRTVMLTGDRKSVGERVAADIGIDEVYSELLPGDKVSKIEELLSNKLSPKSKVAFVGDGINDAPVLARADIGIAMGGIGSDAAIEAADIVLMKDDLETLATSIDIAKRTSNILWQNIVLALGIKALVLLLSTFGMANMWEAVIADVGVALLAVINSSRALK